MSLIGSIFILNTHNHSNNQHFRHYSVGNSKRQYWTEDIVIISSIYSFLDSVKTHDVTVRKASLDF